MVNADCRGEFIGSYSNRYEVLLKILICHDDQAISALPSYLYLDTWYSHGVLHNRTALAIVPGRWMNSCFLLMQFVNVQECPRYLSIHNIESDIALRLSNLIQLYKALVKFCSDSSSVTVHRSHISSKMIADRVLGHALFCRWKVKDITAWSSRLGEKKKEKKRKRWVAILVFWWKVDLHIGRRTEFSQCIYRLRQDDVTSLNERYHDIIFVVPLNLSLIFWSVSVPLSASCISFS